MSLLIHFQSQNSRRVNFVYFIYRYFFALAGFCFSYRGGCVSLRGLSRLPYWWFLIPVYRLAVMLV